MAAAQKLDESSLFERLFSVFETIRRGKSFSMDSVREGQVMDRMAVSSIHGQEVSRVKTKNGKKITRRKRTEKNCNFLVNKKFVYLIPMAAPIYELGDARVQNVDKKEKRRNRRTIYHPSRAAQAKLN